MVAGRTTTGRTGVRPIRLESLAWLRFQRGSLCHRRIATVAESQEDSMMRTTPPNKSVETNRRLASPFNAWRQFDSASCAPPFLSAAVAHLWR